MIAAILVIASLMAVAVGLLVGVKVLFFLGDRLVALIPVRVRIAFASLAPEEPLSAEDRRTLKRAARLEADVVALVGDGPEWAATKEVLAEMRPVIRRLL